MKNIWKFSAVYVDYICAAVSTSIQFYVHTNTYFPYIHLRVCVISNFSLEFHMNDWPVNKPQNNHKGCGRPTYNQPTTEDVFLPEQRNAKFCLCNSTPVNQTPCTRCVPSSSFIINFPAWQFCWCSWLKVANMMSMGDMWFVVMCK